MKRMRSPKGDAFLMRRNMNNKLINKKIYIEKQEEI
jgi:hypothetical protein